MVPLEIGQAMLNRLDEGIQRMREEVGVVFFEQKEKWYISVPEAVRSKLVLAISHRYQRPCNDEYHGMKFIPGYENAIVIFHRHAVEYGEGNLVKKIDMSDIVKIEQWGGAKYQTAVKYVITRQPLR